MNDESIINLLDKFMLRFNDIIKMLIEIQDNLDKSFKACETGPFVEATKMVHSCKGLLLDDCQAIEAAIRQLKDVEEVMANGHKKTEIICYNCKHYRPSGDDLDDGEFGVCTNYGDSEQVWHDHGCEGFEGRGKEA